MDTLDKTHIAIYISTNNKKLYRNWKKYLSQNIFVVYNFNTKFTQELVKWEKSVYNKQVFNNIIITKKFQILINKYCFNNIGYFVE